MGNMKSHTNPKHTIKGQALADFVAECTGLQGTDEEMAEQSSESGPPPKTNVGQNTEHPASSTNHSEEEPQVWKLHVDGSSTDQLSGAGLTLITPEGQHIHCALCFLFKSSNTEA